MFSSVDGEVSRLLLQNLVSLLFDHEVRPDTPVPVS